MLNHFIKEVDINRSTRIIMLIMFAFSTLAWGVQPSAGADCQAWYTVQRGDTLYKIGLKYNITWDRIASANNIANPNKIYAGQVLCIPKAIQPQPTKVPTTVVDTNVQSVKTLTDVHMRAGPGVDYDILGIVKMGQVVKVTGVSVNGLWWRVLCLDGTIGSCWITAGAKYTQIVAVSGATPTPAATPAPTAKPVVIPTFKIVSVVRDQSVTIQTANFPANMAFKVLMGAYGTKGVNGYYVTTTDSGAGGAFTATYTIPAALKGSYRIAIRLEGSGGYFSYNWFYNNTTK